MTTTVNDINDIVRILRERPDWLETIRGIIVGEELLSLPKQLAEFVAATNENFRLVNERLARLETDVAELKVGQAELVRRADNTESRVRRLEGRFSNFEGVQYEQRVRNRLMHRVTMQFGLNAPAIEMTQDIPSSPRLTSIVHRAIQSGTISREQAEDLHEADIIIADSDNRYVVVEVAITADDDDVTRASRRAEILADAAGGFVSPTVVTANPSVHLRDFAEEMKVHVFSLSYP